MSFQQKEDIFFAYCGSRSFLGLSRPISLMSRYCFLVISSNFDLSVLFQFSSNLNGPYKKGRVPDIELGQIVQWHAFRGNQTSLKFAEMTVRLK